MWNPVPIFAYHKVWYCRMKKLEKKAWLVSGFQIIEEEGVVSITIERLCARLNLTKGSFYHHFKNIEGYVKALMDFWLEENTLMFMEQADAMKTAKEKLQALVRLSASSEYRCESRIRGWGYMNGIVREYVKRVDDLRLSYLEGVNRDCGYEPDYARKVATIQYALLIGLQHIYSQRADEEYAELQNIVIDKFDTMLVDDERQAYT